MTDYRSQVAKHCHQLGILQTIGGMVANYFTELLELDRFFW